MMKGVGLEVLRTKIDSAKAEKKDFIFDTRQLKLITGSGPEAVPPRLETPNGTFNLKELTHTQISERLGIPAKYYDRMRTENPALLATNVNEWFNGKPERRMVRTIGDTARAFLSKKFQRIEHEDIAEAAWPILAKLPGLKIPSCEVTERRLYIHFYVDTVEGEVKKGDVVKAGGLLSNSEVGLGAASVAGLIWRLWCLNGATTEDVYRRSHVGRAAEDDGEMTWSDDTRASDDKTVLLKIRDMVSAVVDEARFKKRLEGLRELAGAKVLGSPVAAVEVLAQKLTLTDSEKDGVFRSLIEGADLSAWGLINAVTAQGHTAKDYDRAVEFEQAGGKLINLAPSEWKQVLGAEEVTKPAQAA